VLSLFPLSSFTPLWPFVPCRAAAAAAAALLTCRRRRDFGRSLRGCGACKQATSRIKSMIFCRLLPQNIVSHLPLVAESSFSAVDPTNPLNFAALPSKRFKMAARGGNMGLQKHQEVKKEEIIAAAQQNTEATRRILRQTAATEAMAADTMRELSKQTEQLKDIDRKVDEIDNHITFSERTVRGMSSIFGAIKNVFTSGSYTAPPTSAAAAEHRPSAATSSYFSSNPASPSAPRPRAPSNSSKPFDWQQQQSSAEKPAAGGARNADDYKLRVQEEEQRQEDDLDMIVASIGNLKGMAQVTQPQHLQVFFTVQFARAAVPAATV